jgi:creatinine amidohydrolase/Fe(II)-dependent formamide hydrolase-like protein
MSAETGLARFDTRRAAQNDEKSRQTDFRTIGAREQGQLALSEIEAGAACSEPQASSDTQETTAAGDPTRGELEAALGCARATIDGLRERVQELEAERDRLQDQILLESDR